VEDKKNTANQAKDVAVFAAIGTDRAAATPDGCQAPASL